MNKILLVSAWIALASVTAQAQGTIAFNNSSTTKISTNSVVGGAATGSAGTGPGQYRYALFSSTSATSVNGQTVALTGGTNTTYAFNDSNWTLVAYGTNFFGVGQFVSASANSSGATVVPGVAGGSAANFVVIGWSVNAGTTIANVASWFNGGNAAFPGWIGQSKVSGAITLGGTTTPATLFSGSAPYIQGFTLGLVTPAATVSPVITAQPAGETLPVGANASFSVTAYGTPTPTYQWLFNGSNVIAGATSSKLTINNVQLTNAGSYSVLITNSAGSTNSAAATLTVNAPTGTGYVYFQNSGASATKIYTNTAVDGPATGLTVSGGWGYYYALYVSTNATSVSGQTAAILGADSTSYAFGDSNWNLVAYGTNFLRGQFMSTSPDVFERTVVPGIPGGVPARFVVIGWSANIGTDVGTLQTWFNGGSPAANGWIGQSAVSGALVLGNGGAVATPQLFGTNALALQGFTLGLVSPVAHASYLMPYAPPALVQTTQNGGVVRLSWLTASGSFGVQSAASPVGPWSDTGWTVNNDGTNSWVTVPPAEDHLYFRLVAE